MAISEFSVCLVLDPHNFQKKIEKCQLNYIEIYNFHNFQQTDVCVIRGYVGYMYMGFGLSQRDIKSRPGQATCFAVPSNTRPDLTSRGPIPRAWVGPELSCCRTLWELCHGRECVVGCGSILIQRFEWDHYFRDWSIHSRCFARHVLWESVGSLRTLSRMRL